MSGDDLLAEVRAAARRWFPDGDFTVDLFRDDRFFSSLAEPDDPDTARFRARIIRPALRDGGGWGAREKFGIEGDAVGVWLRCQEPKPFPLVDEGAAYMNFTTTEELRANLRSSGVVPR